MAGTITSQTLMSLALAALLAGGSIFADEKQAQSVEPGAAARAYVAFVHRACDQVAVDLPHIARIAEIAADRHAKGGMLGIPWNGQGLQDELWGRSGGLVHIGDGRPHKRNRTEAEQQQDMAIIGWQRAPSSNKLEELKRRQAKGTYIIGFGPKALPALAEQVAVCDAWFDTGFGDDDRIVELVDGSRVGRGNMLLDMLYGWAFIAEFIAASTREGNMPPVWQAYLYDEGVDWGNRYLGKMQYHTDYDIAPIETGGLTVKFFEHIKGLATKFERQQMPNVRKATALIMAEHRQGRKTICTPMGHAPWTYVAEYEDKAWGQISNLHTNNKGQVHGHMQNTPDGALVLRVGYFGTDSKALEIFAEKQQRVIFISTGTTRGGDSQASSGLHIRDVPADAAAYIDMGLAYGDASVTIDGYPIKVLPPSGIMQLVAYECVNVEVLAAIAAASGTGD